MLSTKIWLTGYEDNSNDLLHHFYIIYNFTITVVLFNAFDSNNLVNITLDKHSLLGLLWLSLACVLAKLSKRVGLCPDKQSVLSLLHILRSASPLLQASILKGSCVWEWHMPWVWSLVHSIQVQGSLNFRLPTRQKLPKSQPINH